MDSGMSPMATRWNLEYRPWRRGGFWNIIPGGEMDSGISPWQLDGFWNIDPGREMESGISPQVTRWILEYHPWQLDGFWNIALAARWILEYHPWQRDGFWSPPSPPPPPPPQQPHRLWRYCDPGPDPDLRISEPGCTAAH